MKTLRVVSYVVNGSGVGHLSRQIAIGRWITRYAAHAGVHLEMWFLTSSEADTRLFHEGFASFKIPSKTAAREAAVDSRTQLALAKQWIWHSLGLLRPDLLIVDTFPRGSYGELLSALDFAARRVFVYRPVKQEVAARPDFQAMLLLYDLILVPEREGDAEVMVGEGARDRLVHTGPVLSRERVEMRPRSEARRELGASDQDRVVLISAGGGGDASADSSLHHAVDALLEEPGLFLVVAAGPLFRGRPRRAPRLTWLTTGELAELLLGVDAAVSAAGYNTFAELMHAGVPTVFLPQEKLADDQHARARRAVEAGAAVMLAEAGSASDLRAAVLALLEPAAHEAASLAARALVPRNHARELAAEALRTVLPPHAVDAAEDAITDDVLARAIEAGVRLTAALGIARALVGDGPSSCDERAITLAIEVLATLRGVEEAAATELVEILLRRHPSSPAAPRARAVRAAIAALAPFADWTSAAVFARSFLGDRALPELPPFVDNLHTEGVSLETGLERLRQART